MRSTVFLTVGTTPFDRLVEAVHTSLRPDLFDVVYQISEHARYIPEASTWFAFDPEIDRYYDAADLIICHAGAGTVFAVLERSHRCVVCPNLSRRDKHQEQLAAWIQSNNYAEVCANPRYIATHVENALSNKNTYSRYVPDPFVGYDAIRNALGIR